MPLRPGDRVRWQYLGKQGDTGTVVKVTKRHSAIGGSRYRVRVCWDKTGSTGSHDDRVLEKVKS